VFILAIVIDFFCLPKNFDFSNTFLGKYAGIGEESLMISAALFLDLLYITPWNFRSKFA